jgi:hypothetical protein
MCLRQHGTPHFPVVGFRAASAKTNNDSKEKHRSAEGVDRIRYATA